jgi:aspartate aminotransferase-like enzyme
MKTAKLPRCYYDFMDQLKTNPAGSTPYTPSLAMLYGLKESIRSVSRLVSMLAAQTALDSWQPRDCETGLHS